MELLRSLAFCLVVGLFAAAPASAAISSSTISSPANGSELFYNGDTGSGNVNVRGTVAGATPGARGDLLCYTVADTRAKTVASGVDVSSGGFAVGASLSPIAGFACRLAMVPAGTVPTGA